MIGLLTPFDVLNYGTKLQAYAVQEIMAKFDEVEIIRFRPNLPERVIRKVAKARYKKKYSDVEAGETVGNVSRELIEARTAALRSFDRFLHFSPAIRGFRSLRARASSYLAVVCGSDQIWNPVNLAEHVCMLEFVPESVKRIAFAPSFGIMELPPELQKIYKKRLEHIQFLSVREASGCEIVRKLGRRDVYWSLDPTFLLEEEEWYRLSDTVGTVPKEKYIFCYFLGNHSFGRRMAAKLREETGDKIAALPHFKSFVPADEHFADYELYDVTPQDFLALIKNADIICTDSFHGTVFSIVFEKEFYCCERHQSDDAANTNDRLYSILNFLGLSDRMIGRAADLSRVGGGIGCEIDYKKVKEILNKKREKTYQFLRDAVRGER